MRIGQNLVKISYKYCEMCNKSEMPQKFKVKPRSQQLHHRQQPQNWTFRMLFQVENNYKIKYNLQEVGQAK